MKKFVCFLMAVIMALTLCACGKETFTCAICGKTVKEKPHTVTILGQEGKICNSCNDGLDALGDLFG